MSDLVYSKKVLLSLCAKGLSWVKDVMTFIASSGAKIYNFKP